MTWNDGNYKTCEPLPDGACPLIKGSVDIETTGEGVGSGIASNGYSGDVLKPVIGYKLPSTDGNPSTNTGMYKQWGVKMYKCPSCVQCSGTGMWE